MIMDEPAYLAAIESQFEALLADTPQKGTKTVRRGEGDSSTVETTEADMIEHRRLQIDARKWLIGKMAPKKYGDKQTHEHAGPDGGPVTLEGLDHGKAQKRMTVHSTRSAPCSGAAEHLACDVVTEVEPRPGGQAS